MQQLFRPLCLVARKVQPLLNQSALVILNPADLMQQQPPDNRFAPLNIRSEFYARSDATCINDFHLTSTLTNLTGCPPVDKSISACCPIQEASRFETCRLPSDGS